jgi:hypothetical protein
LKELYHTGKVEDESSRVILDRSKAYDFGDVRERREWLNVFVALIQYLLSGESQVRFLNNSHPWNLIHKVRTFMSTLLISEKSNCTGKKGGRGTCETGSPPKSKTY